MANEQLLTLRFYVKKQKVNLKIKFKHTEKGAVWITAKKLINPSLDSWNQEEQRFIAPSQDAIHDNEVLSNMMGQYIYVLNHFNPQTPAELKCLVETGGKVEASKVLTLGNYLKQLIDSMKSESVKMPSNNHQLYTTLLNKLEIENHIIHVPLNEISDEHFMSFGNFINYQLAGVNYVNLMKRFHAAIGKAKKSKLTNNILDYNYMEQAPKNIKKAEQKVREGVKVLTIKQLDKFKSMDLYQLSKHDYKHYELYRDFCIFLYETKMRPCDVVKLHERDITNKGTILYYVNKKKNYFNEESAFVETPLTKEAKRIINKYKGQSSKGYVFPFAMNEYDWDLSDSTSYNKWYNRKTKTQEQINNFLHKIEKDLKINGLTIYVFRHSAFTHEINKGEKSLIAIAKEGGTSVNMLEKHYYNHIVK